MTLSDLWLIYHPYINHIVFGFAVGLISLKIFQKLGYIKDRKTKYLLPTVATAIALVLFKFYESTLPLNTATFIPGVFLNVNQDISVKILRGSITVFFGFLAPAVDGIFIRMKKR